MLITLEENMVKNIFKFSLALLVSAFVSISAKAETVITVVDWQSGVGGITNAYADFIKEFEAANPGVKVEYTQYTVSTYNEFLKPALSSGKGPDIFAVYPGPDLDEVMNAGHLVNITEEADAEWKGWLGNNINIPELSRNGNLYLAPQDAFTEEIWVYNDMIKDLGFELPAFGDSYTVDEWVAIGNAAKEKGLDGLMFGPVEAWCVFDGFANFVNQGNQNYPEDSLGMALDGKISWDQPMFRDALNAYKTLNDNGVWRKDSLSMDYQVQAWGKWLEREGVGIYCNGDWFISSAPADYNTPDSLGITMMSYPKLSSDSPMTYNKATGTNLGINANSPNKDLAMEFVKLTNSPNASMTFASYGQIPANLAQVDMDALAASPNLLFNDGIKMLATEGRNTNIYYSQAEPMKHLYDGIMEMFLGVTSVDDIVEKMNDVTGYSG
tara:strand:- start:31 stop:1347 length:1317 start_codon:yes stop_codon:yes gene_type:complete